MITYSIAEVKDVEAITRLLKINDLPFLDIQESAIEFIVAKNDSELIGCVGLEKHGTEGLLRSFAVENDFRNKGIGKEMYNRLLGYATQNHIKTLHLLTNTAKDYFSKTGFIIANRSKAPELISKTREFASLCPASSVYMVLEDISAYVLYYSSEILKKQTDIETNSVYWAVKGNKVMFTHFSVPSKVKFETHSHSSEQITHVLSGELVFEISDQLFRLAEGDTIVIPSDAPHSVYSENGAVAVDAWAPVNEKY